MIDFNHIAFLSFFGSIRFELGDTSITFAFKRHQDADPICSFVGGNQHIHHSCDLFEVSRSQALPNGLKRIERRFRMVANYPGPKWTKQVLAFIELRKRRIAVMLVADGERALHYARKGVSLIANFVQVINVLDIA